MSFNPLIDAEHIRPVRVDSPSLAPAVKGRPHGKRAAASFAAHECVIVPTHGEATNFEHYCTTHDDGSENGRFCQEVATPAEV